MKHKLSFLILIGFLFIASSCNSENAKEPQFLSNPDLFIGSWFGIVEGTKAVDTNLEISVDFTETTITVSLAPFQYGMLDTEIEASKLVHNLGKFYWNDTYKIISDNGIEISFPTDLVIEHPKSYTFQFLFSSNKDTLYL